LSELLADVHALQSECSDEEDAPALSGHVDCETDSEDTSTHDDASDWEPEADVSEWEEEADDDLHDEFVVVEPDSGLRRSSRNRSATGAQGFRYDPAKDAARPQLGRNHMAYFLDLSKGRDGASGSKARKHLLKASVGDEPDELPPPENHDPKFGQAMSDLVHGKKWREAMQSEWDNLFATGAFTWIKRSKCDPTVKALPCHVVCKYKALAKRYKCRVVINGSRQVAGSYGETYAATVAACLVRMILCIGVHFSWDIRVFDYFL